MGMVPRRRARRQCRGGKAQLDAAGAERSEGVGVPRLAGKVAHLAGVGLEIEQHLGVLRGTAVVAVVELVLERATLDHQVGAPELADGFVVVLLVPRPRVAAHQRQERAAVEPAPADGLCRVGQRHVGGVAQRGEEVAQVDVGTDPSARAAPRVAQRLGRTHDQRHANAALEKLLLLPDTVLAQHLAVVGGVEDPPVIEVLAVVFQRREDAGVVGVGLFDHAAVRRGRTTDLTHGDVPTDRDAPLAEEGMLEHGLLDVRLNAVEVVGEAVVAAEVGIVRAIEADLEQRRPPAARPVVEGVTVALVDEAQGTVEDVVVLGRMIAGARALDFLGVGPFAVAQGGIAAGLVGQKPVDEVFADAAVGADASGPALHLVGAVVVELAAADGGIAVLGEAFGEGHGERGQVLAVAFDAAGARQLPGGEALPRGHADRRRRVGVLEHHTLRDEAVKRRRPHHAMPRKPRDVRTMLIRHQEQNVGS